MESIYDITQREIHPKDINKKVGCLGPHKKIIEVGDEPHIVFQEGSNVPFCMAPKDCVPTDFIQYDGPQLKDIQRLSYLVILKVMVWVFMH